MSLRIPRLAYFLGKLRSIKEGRGTLLDHTMASWRTVQGEAGHALTDLPLMLCGRIGFGIKHQGHLARKDTWVGSVWESMVDRVGMPRPGSAEKPFQAGPAGATAWSRRWFRSPHGRDAPKLCDHSFFDAAPTPPA